ncbi:hypothetical protein MGG_11512 [Pyricularia oryzae 70-15]|uniref:Bromo domain-containing protein n=1 Tax=Pyricularia oryzae (strain 70-15 / ATCC MYA-4617 / FGSC 8958) TaxID=242507 RepID=G4NAY3_PYRO7|nr:uncharacterized protein MGG_11512 [Pyricularia oryzae 70-15]EHA48745.1 hypothetical protein MGG_11512 [Pyricularia oryzae 70-15]KAI7928893.1 hypothetical protein M9X92_001472 [Pyricularia oryzae]
MENKRKAAQGQAVNTSDADDRASKRRKVPADAEYDLLKEETPESTTHYGLQFLQQIRRTSDKTGRQVATYFEQLLPKEGNEAYYAKTRMPISLGTIERKLVNHEFSNLSELESWFKRMVSNAKDFYDKGSQVYEDAERVRKALSNYMVKTNPAYKLISNYSAIAVPIPDDYPDDAGDEPVAKPTPSKAAIAKSPESRRSSAAQSRARAKPEPKVDEEDEGEEEEEEEGDDKEEGGAGSDEDGEGEGDGEGDDEEGEGDEESDAEPISGRRRGPGRPPKKPDTQYKGVDYKGLTFQQAQEKIVEELLRKKEQPGDDFAHFEPFLNLPPRTLKDYYQVIKEPICLKKLAKLVRGIHSRRDKPGKSDFKSWSAFEEKSSLLWKNAYYYNEDGSEIAVLAKEMEDFFNAELNKAKAVVQEPPQPSIKLKLNAPTPKEPLPRKIIIRAPGSRAESPGPATGQSAGSMADGTASDTVMTPALAKSDPASSAVQSPSVQVKTTDMVAARDSASPEDDSPAPEANGQPQPVPETAAPPSPPQPSPESIIAAKLAKLYSTKHRLAGRGLANALITDLAIRTHPQLRTESRYEFRLPAHPKLSQQSVTITVPMSSWTVQIVPSISPQVLNGTRPYKIYVMVNGRVLPRMPSPAIPNGGTPLHMQQTDDNQMVFDAQLVPGINKISVQIVAATPKDAKLPDGLDAEFEMYTILANLSRQ